MAEATAAEDCPDEGADEEACPAGVGAGAGAQAAAGVIVIQQPPDGEVVRVPTQDGQRYLLDFPPELAEVRVIDADGDGNPDLVLVFNEGTAQESQIVFLDLPAHAGGSNPPIFEVAGVVIGSGALVAQAEALAGQQPTLDTAAGEAEGEPGHGTNQYSDDLGTPIDLLDPQGVIPPVFLEFGLPAQELTVSATLSILIKDTEPTITIDKEGPATIDEGGANVVYSFTITNTSDTTVPVTVTPLEDDTLDAAGDAALFAAALAAYQALPGNAGATEIVLEADESLSFEFDPDGELVLDVGDQHTNTVTVTAVDVDGDTATGDDMFTVTGDDVLPVIAVTKTADSATINEGGDSVTYTFVITNNSVSTDPVTITAISDSVFGDLLAEAEADNGNMPIVLAGAGGMFTFDIVRDVLINAGETHTNVVTVTGVDDEQNSTQAMDDETVEGDNVAPAIMIVKDGPATVDEGETEVTYTYAVTNESAASTDSELLITLLVDDAGTPNIPGDDLFPEFVGGDTDGDGLLDFGETWMYSLTTIILLEAEQSLTNTVTVTAVDNEGDTAMDDDSHTVSGEELPIIFRDASIMSFNTDSKIGNNDHLFKSGDLFGIDFPTNFAFIFRSEEEMFGASNNIDAVHAQMNGSIIFSTESGGTVAQDAAHGGNVSRSDAAGEVDLWVFDPREPLGSQTTVFTDFLFPVAFAESALLDALFILPDMGGLIFSTLTVGDDLDGVTVGKSDLVHWDGAAATEIFDGDDYFVNGGGGDPIKIEFVDLVLDMDGNETGVTPTGVFIDQSADADIDALHITTFSDVGGLATGVTGLFIESMIISVTGDLKDSDGGTIRFNDADMFEIRFATDGTATVVSTPVYTALNDALPSPNEVPIDAYTRTDILDLRDILDTETNFMFGDPVLGNVADYVLLTDTDGAGGDTVSVAIDPDGGGDSFGPPIGFITGFQMDDVVTAVVGPVNGETDFLTVM